MEKRYVLVLAILLLSGCNSGLFQGADPSTGTDGNQQLQFVVQNEAESEQTVTVTFVSENGTVLLNKTESVSVNGAWEVSTTNVSAVKTPLAVTMRLPERGYEAELVPIRSSDRGSRLHTITEDGIGLYECNSNTSCWKPKAFE